MKLAKQAALTHPVFWVIAWKGVQKVPFFLPHDKSFFALKHFLNEDGGLFLDVGANDGISALSFRRISRNYRILSIEPNQIHTRSLERLKRNMPGFDYALCGASDSAGQVTLFTPVYRHIALHNLTSVNREQAMFTLTQTYGQKIAKRSLISESLSPVIRIDQLNINPSIIKIDVEGSEYQVLMGASETISRSRPWLMIEVLYSDTSRIKEFFSRIDYCLTTYDVDSDCFVLASDSSLKDAQNAFAIPAERAAALPFCKTG
jgi:FkbM family methyltransferase